MQYAGVAAASTPPPRSPATPKQRSSLGVHPSHHGRLSATYDAAAAGTQNAALLSPQVRRATVVAAVPPQRQRALHLGLSFDESLLPLQEQQRHQHQHQYQQQQQYTLQQQQPSRKILAQSISSSHERPPPPPSNGWSLGASVYCRFVHTLFSN
jgi:hypothetical protein